MEHMETQAESEEQNETVAIVDLENEDALELEIEELPAFQIALIQGCSDAI